MAYVLGSTTAAAIRMREKRAAAGPTEHPCVGDCGRTMVFTKRGQVQWCCEDCRPARRAAAVARHEPKRLKGRARSLWDIHRITPAEYEAMFAAQGGRCAGCRQMSKPLHIDHQHGCPNHQGRRTCAACRRGLLCADCNHTIGMSGDSPTTLRALADYLEGGV